MPRKKIKKKGGMPKKDELDKKVRKDFTMDRTTLALLENATSFGFKNMSTMVNAAVISLARQHQAKVFVGNLLPDKNGVL